MTEPASPAVRAHLAACAACRERQSELQSLAGELAALGRALPRAENPALVRRIVARIPKVAASSNAGWRWAAGLAAAAALLFVIVLANRQTPTETVPSFVTIPAPARPEPETPPPPPVPAPPPTPGPSVPAPRPPEPAPVVPSPDPAPSAPTPKPADPVKPAPRPVDAPKPAPAPESRPARVAVTLANLEGAAEMQDGAAWKKLMKTAEWDAADAVRSGDRMARFTLPDGTRATLRPHSEVRLLTADPPSLSLEKGEGYFEVIPGAARRFSVATPDARIEVTGTQFSVKRGDRTEILVSSGEVKVTNEKGEVSVPAGNATTARKGSAPTKPRIFDTDRATSWRRELDAPELIRVRFDFEDGRLPAAWTNGKIAAGPARGLNRGCLEGNPGIDADLSRLDKRIPVAHGTLKVRFRYWTSGADVLWVQLFCDRIRDNFRFDVKALGKEKWETVEIPLSDFYRLADGSHPQEGDRFSWMNFSVSGTAGPVYFDDIELVELLK